VGLEQPANGLDLGQLGHARTLGSDRRAVNVRAAFGGPAGTQDAWSGPSLPVWTSPRRRPPLPRARGMCDAAAP
jgi:hypothetical protein